LGKKKGRKLLKIPEINLVHYYNEQDSLIYICEFRQFKVKDTTIYACSEVICSNKVVLYLNRRV